jgi:hypothetical protein
LRLAQKNVADNGLGDRIDLGLQPVERLDEDAKFTLAWLPAPFIPQETVSVALPRIDVRWHRVDEFYLEFMRRLLLRWAAHSQTYGPCEAAVIPGLRPKSPLAAKSAPPPPVARYIGRTRPAIHRDEITTGMPEIVFVIALPTSNVVFPRPKAP